MAQAVTDREPILVGEDERVRIAEVERVLETPEAGRRTLLIGPSGEATELPASLYDVLLRVARELADGHGVAILPMEAMVTTQQAADLLGISRPSLVRLLESGALPFERIRSHRRIRLADLIEYRRRRDAERAEALGRIVRAAQARGVYDAYEPARTR
jgi:excisionase family DNA binding protein